MTEEEVEIVAEELAKIGGTSWYPGRENSSILRVISDRYRDRARAAIAALDRHRGRQDPASQAGAAGALPEEHDGIREGDTVIYRPPGDRRAYSCTVETIKDGQAYLVVNRREGVGWISIPDLLQTKRDNAEASRDNAT